MGEPAIIQVFDEKINEPGTLDFTTCVWASITLIGAALKYKPSVEQLCEKLEFGMDARDKRVVFRIKIGSEVSTLDSLINSLEDLCEKVIVLDTSNIDQIAMWVPGVGMLASFR